MSKNIVVCCDGTDNQFSGNHTNVIRTYKVALRSEQQVTFYDCGVGTMPEPWNTGRWKRRWSVLKGLAFGSGFMDNIEEAYRFLMHNFQPGDKVFLFGFSRGAYTARALAGMLYSVGLLHRGSENLIRYAQEYWQKDHRDRDPNNPKTTGQVLCEEFKKTLSRSCPVHFIGVWDTVGSVGYINQFKTFPFTANNPEVSHVRHAVSIDERRSCFRQNLMWQFPRGQDVKNVLFAGVHSDVGGGYPPAEAGLAKISFRWMMREAARCGLKIDCRAFRYELCAGELPDANADAHESLKGAWRPVELIPVRRYKPKIDKKTGKKTDRYSWRIPFAKRRGLKENAGTPGVYLHQSVLDRVNTRIDYRPPNLFDKKTREWIAQFQVEK